MSTIRFRVELDDFPDLPVVLDERDVTVMGRHLAARIDLSEAAMTAGDRLGRYLDALQHTLLASKFRWHYELRVAAVAPPALAVNLARIHWEGVDFTATDFSGSTLDGAVRLTDCRVASELPAISLSPGEPMVYPPERAATDLQLQGIREQLVLRWGLQRGSHLAEALLWLEPRHPTGPLLEKILRRAAPRVRSLGTARD
jgi:hypothetical protein